MSEMAAGSDPDRHPDGVVGPILVIRFYR